MKKRLGLIFFIAVITVGAIFVFQLYWVYNSYKTGESNFNKLVTNALQTSINDYQLQQSQLSSKLMSKNSSLSVMSSFSEGPTSLIVKNGKIQGHKTLYNVQIEPVQVSKNNVVIVQQMIARLMAQATEKAVDIVLLSKLYQTELRKNNIELPVKLFLISGKQGLPANKIAAFVGFSKDNVIVEAKLGNVNRYLLKQNLVPAMVSILLIMLSAGSLFHMGFIIRKLILLDGLKNDFINNITHELRTPISILKSTHEILYKFGEASDPVKTIRYLQINTDILDKMETNVDRILDITRYEQGVMPVAYTLVDIDCLINDIINRFKLITEAVIKYRSELNKNEVLTDAYIIDTVISNLIDNAIKYGGKKVNILITVSDLNKGLKIEVHNDGESIAGQYLPFLFDKFYRIPAGNRHDVKGYGLGLSYVKELVSRLNGNIAVKSNVKEGTVFTIQLPVYG